MLGKRGPQRGLFEADTTYGAFVGRDSFYGWLASQRGELFRDEAFAGLYVLTNGRPSVPPSLLATALVLQTYDGVSDDEAKQRADYDLRWKVALGVELDARPFAKSTLQEFRAQLIVHAEQAAIFRTSLELAKRLGKFRTKSGEVGVVEAAGLRSRVLVQDVERRDDGPALEQGVAKDRLLSVHDPEMRHGRKSASKRFDGHKAAVAVDTDEPLITAVAVLPGNAP